jgi:hypothetical protein
VLSRMIFAVVNTVAATATPAVAGLCLNLRPEQHAAGSQVLKGGQSFQ